jgi:hypothetical protein
MRLKEEIIDTRLESRSFNDKYGNTSLLDEDEDLIPDSIKKLFENIIDEEKPNRLREKESITINNKPGMVAMVAVIRKPNDLKECERKVTSIDINECQEILYSWDEKISDSAYQKLNKRGVFNDVDKLPSEIQEIIKKHSEDGWGAIWSEESPDFFINCMGFDYIRYGGFDWDDFN